MKSKILILFLVLFLISFVVSAKDPKIDCNYLSNLADASAEKNMLNFKPVRFSPDLELEQKMRIMKVPKKFKDNVVEELTKVYPKIDPDKSTFVFRKTEVKNGNPRYHLDIQLIDKEGYPVTFSKDGMGSYRRTFSFNKEGNLIVENDLLFVAEDYRNQGIATTIYDLEDGFYKSLDVKEVYITATFDGRAMWAKKEFGFKFVNPDLIEKKWGAWLKTKDGQTWLKTTGGYNKPLENHPYLYPRQFLNTFSEIFYVKTY